MKSFLKLLIISFVFLSCESNNNDNKHNVTPFVLKGDNWAEKLGYGKESKVIILHADDIGMCSEANEAVIPYLINNHIQSASVMVPCPWFNDIAIWYKNNPEEDIGLHLTLTSEWKHYRWGPVSKELKNSNLTDSEGYLWRKVEDVVSRVSGNTIEREIRAQINRARQLGIEPGHIDTHMGTLYSKVEYAEIFFRIAMEYGIPANVIEFTPELVEKFKKQGYPITNQLVASASKYTLPKIDNMVPVPNAKSYKEKKESFYTLIKNLEAGITEIYFHPSIESPGLKKITNSWQQRVWEAQMFSDPDVISFLKKEGVLFTNWKEMMQRYKAQ